MPAAYYDIQADEGSSFRLKLKFLDSNKKLVNLVNPPASVIEGFEDSFRKDTDGNYVIKAYARMQVRDSVDGDILPVDQNNTPTNMVDDTNLWGQSNLNYTNIQIKLKDDSTDNDSNIIITIDANVMSNIDYGNFLYDLELVFSQDIITNPKAVTFRIMQGRFIVTPNITR
jgi:hypothetical protein